MQLHCTQVQKHLKTDTALLVILEPFNPGVLPSVNVRNVSFQNEQGILILLKSSVRIGSGELEAAKDFYQTGV